jgi:hypothetical protein
MSAAATPASCAALDSHAEIEHEQLVQQRVDQRHADGDAQRDRRAADAVEETQHRPQGDAERGAQHARMPIGQRQMHDIARQSERAKYVRARQGQQRKQGDRE